MNDTTEQRVKATIVGSLPKPGWLAKPAELFPPWCLDGAGLDGGGVDIVLCRQGAQNRLGNAKRGESYVSHSKS